MSACYIALLTVGVGIQMFSILTPPILILNSIRKKTFNVNRFLRSSMCRASINANPLKLILTVATVGAYAIGAPFGAFAGWGRMRNMEEV